VQSTQVNIIHNIWVL